MKRKVKNETTSASIVKIHFMKNTQNSGKLDLKPPLPEHATGLGNIAPRHIIKGNGEEAVRGEHPTNLNFSSTLHLCN